MYPQPYVHDDYVGGLEDTIVHSLLIGLLTKFVKAHLMYVDTHAGAGKYAIRTARYRRKQLTETTSGLLYKTTKFNSEYLRFLRQFNGQAHRLHIYPGSPLISTHYLKNVTNIFLTEISQTVSNRLRKNVGRASTVITDDGYMMASSLCIEANKAFVYIDPPYDRDTDYERVFNTVIRCSISCNAIIVSTFPAANIDDVQRAFALVNALRSSGVHTSAIALEYYSKVHLLRGAGMLVANAPVGFARVSRQILRQLIVQLQLRGGRLHAR